MLLTLLQSGGAGPGVTQTSRFDNVQSFPGGVVTDVYTLTQASRFNNAQSFYGGTLVVTQRVAQSARVDNAQTFFSGVVNQVQRVDQASLFTNRQAFYAHRVSNLKYFTVDEMDEICGWLKLHCTGPAPQVWLRRR